jgi:NhaA family Na+:H+ antiporter
LTVRRIPSRATNAIRAFIQIETAGGLALVAAAAVALLWANLTSGDGYTSFWTIRSDFRLGPLDLGLDLKHWVNEGLMTLFFFVVGLEIKRELVDGELSDRRVAALPVIAAAGGMIVPALLYAAFNWGGPAVAGWGIPVATDIAFVVGALALLGPRAPRGLKVFLLSLAIADDVAAIVVIALFYSGSINIVWLAASAALCLLIVALQRAGVSSVITYLVLGSVIWLGTLQSGVHATLAGVALGFLTPTRSKEGSADRAPAERLQEALHPWTSFLVVPLFALANAGIELDPEAIRTALASPVTLGVLAGLVLGKTLGIAGFSLIAVRIGLGVLPGGVRWSHLVGGAALGGIGFTVSLFIADIAFTGALLSQAKVGILFGSATAAVLGAGLLSYGVRVSPKPPGRDAK